jgi:pantetheine-phosphate adenylyltransferase
MARVGVYPGTFDPPTLGHLDIIGRATLLFDRLVVGVFTNSSKAPLFTLEERLLLLAREVATLPGTIEVVICQGLLVDFARIHGAQAIVRGLRSSTDFDYESQMTGMNRAMAPDIDTVFLVAEAALQPIASSLVKDVAKAGGDVHRFVSAGVAQDMMAKLGRQGADGR